MAEHEQSTSEELGHEPTAVSARAVWVAVVILLGGIIAALGLMAGLGFYLAGVEGGLPTVRPPGTTVAPPPGVPAVDANQVRTRRELQAQEQRILTEYAWIDQEEGVARIPINRAMEILAEEPARTPESGDDESAAQ